MHMITQDLHRKKSSRHITLKPNRQRQGSLGEILPCVSPQSDIHMWRKAKVFTPLSHLFYLPLPPFGILVDVTFLSVAAR